jgi:glutathione S-transferase
MSMISPSATIEISGYRWVPEFAQGFVRDLRPRWACEEAGIHYRERLANVANKPDWLVEGQPWSQIPIMRDGDISFFESGATLLHLAGKSEILLPADPQAQANAISWLFAAFNTVEPPIFEHGNISFFAKGEEWAVLRRPSLEEFLGRRLAPLEKLLDGQEWLDTSFSVADIAMVSTLRALSGSRIMDGQPAISAYIARGEARPGFKHAMTDQLAAFARHPENAD